jgi:restriction system protein
MLPLLKFSADGNEHSSRETVDAIAKILNLTDAEKNETYASGKSVPRIYDRVHWAITYLKGAGLLQGTRRGFFQITERGRKVLDENPAKLDKNISASFLSLSAS